MATPSSATRTSAYSPGQSTKYGAAGRRRLTGPPGTSAGIGGRGAVDQGREQARRLLHEKGVVTLPVLRFKDLRHLLPTAWNALGLPAEDLPEIMGWAKGSGMAERYTTARIVG